MSTLQTTPRRLHTDTRSPRSTSRIGAVAVALGVLIAIGASVLILALSGAHQTAAPTPTPAHAQAAPASLTAPPSGGYFRDPTTHALLNVRTEGCDAAQLRVEKSCARP
jgi:hypothetical protein